MINSTAAANKPITIIVSVDNPPIISTPLSPTERLSNALEALGFIASVIARHRGDARSHHHCTNDESPHAHTHRRANPNRSLLDCSKVTDEVGEAENGSAETPAKAGDKNHHLYGN
jgi:hypothetical protein